MSRTFKTVNYEQALDLTVRLGDCLPPDHLARFVVDSVAQLDLSALYANSGTRGGEPYARRPCCWACCSMAMPPGCSARARSSGPRMRRCRSALSRATCTPTTIHWPRIARTFLPELKNLFGQVVFLAPEARGLKLGTISLDGTKVHADPSNRQGVSSK